MIENFHLVWLDENNNETKRDFHSLIIQLQQLANTVNTFVDIDECINFITDMSEETVFLIVSKSFSSNILSVVKYILQIRYVYIFCENLIQSENWNNSEHKFKGVYTSISSICETIQRAVKDYERNSISISFIKQDAQVSNKNLDTLHCSFMYTQILKEILVTIDFNQEHIDQFLTYCENQFVDNSKNFKTINMIRTEYHQHDPIWWYTSPTFLYSVLNRALRLMEIDLIVKIGFFLSDLYRSIQVLHAEQFNKPNQLKPFTVYRGQSLSQTDFNQLKNTEGGLLAFNNFLSTSRNRQVSAIFAESNSSNPDLVGVGVLFLITIDPSIDSTSFANIKHISYYDQEEEILFSMHSVFRIGQIQQCIENTQIWEVELTLTSDNDPQLFQLTKKIQEETSMGANGWLRLGELLIKLAQFDKAEELYKTLMKQTVDQRDRSRLFQQLGTIKMEQGEYANAVEYYDKSIKIKEIYYPDSFTLAVSYNNIGQVYHNVSEYSEALKYLEKTLLILEKNLPLNDPGFANFYNNIGRVHYSLGSYAKALEYFKKALPILEKNLPANHPTLAMFYNNLGLLYNNINEYSKALIYYEKALEIQDRILPSYHPSLAISNNNIGLAYDNIHEYSKALEYYEKSLEIYKKKLFLSIILI